ncbi:hypothetical protein ACFL96_01275 [Thermoproteota archaeon]
MYLLDKLSQANLPVIQLLWAGSAEQSIISIPAQNEYGYLMVWIPGAVQLEAKTPDKMLNLQALALILAGRGAQIESSEYGKTAIKGMYENLIIENEFAINSDILEQLLTDLTKIAAYRSYIIDLQVLIDSRTGEVVIIDPMDILDPGDSAITADQNLTQFVTQTRQWLNSLIEFLQEVKKKLEDPTPSHQGIFTSLIELSHSGFSEEDTDLEDQGLFTSLIEPSPQGSSELEGPALPDPCIANLSIEPSSEGSSEEYGRFHVHITKRENPLPISEALRKSRPYLYQ